MSEFNWHLTHTERARDTLIAALPDPVKAAPLAADWADWCESLTCVALDYQLEDADFIAATTIDGDNYDDFPTWFSDAPDADYWAMVARVTGASLAKMEAA